MECACIRYTDLPHATRLFTDLAYHFDRVRTFYPYSPHDGASFREAAARISFPPERRAAMAAALREQNGDSAELDLLAQPGTVAVVTGQQVGLFSGPAYTIYKALTAAKLARALSAQGIPAVPVFWLATEDHDFAEVNHCWVFDSSHHPVKLEVDGSQAPGQPVGGIRMPAPPTAEMAAALQGFPFGQEIAGLVQEAYAPGANLGQAFATLLRKLLPNYGLLVVDPMQPAMRELAAGPIRSALEVAPELTSEVLDRNQALAAAGYHAQVHVEAHTAFVFLLENNRRVALRRNGREYLANGRRFSTEELMERAATLSPNALLRPVVQDAIFPTVAYVGGPAELAYLAQSEVIYKAILGRMPVAMPRSGFTMLDWRTRKLIKRYRLSLQDVFRGSEFLRERMAEILVPEPLARTLDETETEIARSLERLYGELERFDPTLAAALATSRRKITYQLEKIGAKVGRESLSRHEQAGSDAEFLEALIYPHKHLQERFYSIIPLLAKHGPDLVDRIYENVRLDCPDHQLLMV
ncbi:MAG: bacillithiol biosynthesis cysteine-adding enzyme BshC [Bryobacteraceae bacterium]